MPALGIILLVLVIGLFVVLVYRGFLKDRNEIETMIEDRVNEALKAKEEKK